ncbi:MAG: hypothetical protein ACHQ1G_08680 [Planctomycetota bacterium]
MLVADTHPLLLVPFVALVTILAMRYRRCPPGKVLVVYGKVAGGKAAKCVRRGGTFVLPIIQDYAYLDLEPVLFTLPREAAPWSGNFTVVIDTDPAVLPDAAVHLLGFEREEIGARACDVILGALRQAGDPTRTEDQVAQGLRKIGLKLVHKNNTDGPGQGPVR